MDNVLIKNLMGSIAEIALNKEVCIVGPTIIKTNLPN